MQKYIALLLCAAASYVIGSTNGAIISSKLFYGKDIRDYGSGNAGLTNFYRVFGKSGALLVIAIDFAKTAVSVVCGAVICRGTGFDFKTAELLLGICVMLGHIFPIFYGFHGGKAVLSAETVVLMFDWRIGILTLAVFAVIVLLTRYVSLGSMIGGLSFPLFTALFGYPAIYAALAFACAALLVIKHSENIKRLVHGSESKFNY